MITGNINDRHWIKLFNFFFLQPMYKSRAICESIPDDIREIPSAEGGAGVEVVGAGVATFSSTFSSTVSLAFSSTVSSAGS